MISLHTTAEYLIEISKVLVKSYRDLAENKYMTIKPWTFVKYVRAQLTFGL